MLRSRCLFSLLIGVGIILVLAGCGDRVKVTELPQGEKNLRIIFKAYTQGAQRLGRSPKNAEELKPFLQEYGNPDELLISPNDGKPYVIVPGLNLKRQQASPVLAYEQEGKDGRRQYIGLGSSAVQTATDEEFARLLKPPRQ